jgi:hypothetical protein
MGITANLGMATGTADKEAKGTGVQNTCQLFVTRTEAGMNRGSSSSASLYDRML